jgi:hypothetical protein
MQITSNMATMVAQMGQLSKADLISETRMSDGDTKALEANLGESSFDNKRQEQFKDEVNRGVAATESAQSNAGFNSGLFEHSLMVAQASLVKAKLFSLSL